MDNSKSSTIYERLKSNFAIELANLLENEGCTHEECAKKSGLSYVELCSILEANEDISFNVVAKIATAFGKTVRFKFENT
jgi:transcriptional regulator with XRE-family HTH domain